MNTAALQSFRTFLVSRNYSDSTVRNYLSDVSSYFEFVKNSNPFSLDILSSYLQSISSDPNYSRYLSSLSKFFQFSLDQGLTQTNPLKTALKNKKPNFDEILNNYQDFLVKKNFSDATIRNYLNDIRQFSDWNPNPNQNPPSSAIAEFTSLKKGGLISKLKLPFFKGRSSDLSEQKGLNESQ